MTDHASLRHLAGGYVLGALSPDDRERFESHLAGCASCREEVAALAPIPSLLSRAGTPASVELPAGLVDRAARTAGDEWEALSKSRSRWRLVAGIAAVVLLFSLIAPRIPATDPGPLALDVVSAVATGQVEIDERAWGTAVFLSLEDLPARDRYVVWVVDVDGNRQQAATWGPTPAGKAVVQGASSIDLARVVEIAVTDGSGSEQLLSAGV